MYSRSGNTFVSSSHPASGTRPSASNLVQPGPSRANPDITEEQRTGKRPSGNYVFSEPASKFSSNAPRPSGLTGAPPLRNRTTKTTPSAMVPARSTGLTGAPHDSSLSHADRVAQELRPRGTGGKPTATTRGKAIQAELDTLMDDMYGRVASQAPPSQTAPKSSGVGRGAGRFASAPGASGKPMNTRTGGAVGRGSAEPPLGRKKSSAAAEEVEYLGDSADGRDAYDAAVSASEYNRLQSTYTGALSSSWMRGGPLNPEGRAFDASDRNLLCMDVCGNLCVVGSADHGLKVFDIQTCREKRNLYTKTAGHTEWVTACKFLSDGKRVVSGGMDSKLCLWHATSPRCEDLLGHTGSISHVEVNDYDVAISSSYDRTLRIWNCGGAVSIAARPAPRSCVGTLAGHSNSVLTFTWCGGNVTSGDRSGGIKFWDVETASCVGSTSTTRGQVGSLSDILDASIGHLSAVGDQGGVVSLYDFHRGNGRGKSSASPVFQKVLHPGGVVSGLRYIPDSSLLVSCGADRVIQVLESRMGFQPLFTFTDHRDYIYSLETFGKLILSGGGNGWLLAHDSTTGKCLYGLGANEAAVREIFASPTQLVAAGDDGKAMVYDF